MLSRLKALPFNSINCKNRKNAPKTTFQASLFIQHITLDSFFPKLLNNNNNKKKKGKSN